MPAVPPSSTSIEGACDKQHLLTAAFVTGDGDVSPPPTVFSVQRPMPGCVVPLPVVMDHIAQFGMLDMVTTFVENEIWETSGRCSPVQQ